MEHWAYNRRIWEYQMFGLARQDFRNVRWSTKATYFNIMAATLDNAFTATEQEVIDEAWIEIED
jgi:hypothetical protein